ncbi:MAG: cytochrome D ubiquinol oxidase subunit II, partial [Clostridium sp.]
MDREKIMTFLREHWYTVSVLIGTVILIGAIRNWNWLCDPT